MMFPQILNLKLEILNPNNFLASILQLDPKRFKPFAAFRVLEFWENQRRGPEVRK